MHDGLLPIGAFARAASLSIGTLRHYHETGLLTPVRVDPASGYRYYSAAQLVDAEVIRRLRDLDLPVEQVRRVLDARDDGVTAAVVHEHQQRMLRRLHDAERIVRDLHRLSTQPLVLLAARVHDRALPDLDVLSRNATLSLDRLGEFLGRAYPELAAEARREGLAVCGPAGALYPGDDWDAAAVTVTAYLPVVGEAHPPHRQRLPGGRFAVAVHEGSFETIADTYRGVGAWLARQASGAGLDIRETYLVGPGDTADEHAHRTEVAWPLVGDAPDPSTDRQGAPR
ncbi:MAG: MerR family transcriptional regulator [Dermatophilaceae bacterium]